MVGVQAVSRQADEVYDAVSRAGEIDTRTLGLTTGLAEPALLEAIDELSRAGLVRGGDPARLSISSGATTALYRIGRSELSPVARSLIEARQVLQDLLEPDSSPKIERVTNLEVLMERLDEMLSGAEHEILNLHAGRAPEPHHLADAEAADLELLKRGVAVRTVCPRDFIKHPHMADYTRMLADHGATIRFSDQLPHRVIVADAKCAVVPINTARPEYGAVFVRDPSVVRSLHHLCVSILRSSKPLVEAERADEAPTDLEREVLVLMSSGMTDTVSAGRLGVTERQFRRYVARILEKLGAQSRFQAGVQAVERGWL